MPTHYTPQRVSLLRLIRWRHFIFELLIPIILVLMAIGAWVDGSAYVLHFGSAAWLYIFIVIGRAAGSVRALQVHCSAAFVWFFGWGVYNLIAGIQTTDNYPNLLSGLTFGIVAFIVELHCRISRIEAPTNHARAADHPGIYRITCKPNRKQYVGQTSQAITARWAEHRAHLQSGRHHNRWMQADWDLYRPEHFTWEVLEVVTDPVWLLDRERHWQDKDYDATKRYNPPNIAPRIAKASRRPPMKKRRRPA